MENNLNILIYDEMLELKKFESKIKGKIMNNSNEIIFQKYGLLNKNWIEKYKKYYNYEHFLQKNEFISPSYKQNIFFDITVLLPKFDESSLNDDVEDIKNLNCSIPINFTLVSINFLNLIKQHFYNSQNKDLINLNFDGLIYEILIGGKCIFIKDKKNPNSYLIQEYKEYNINNMNSNTYEIHYILRFIDKPKRDRDLNLILSSGLSEYLAKRNITPKPFQKLYNSNNELIGYFFNLLIKDENKTKCMLNLSLRKTSNHNIDNNLNHKTSTSTSIKTKEINNIIDPFLHSVLLCFYQIEEIKNYFLNKDNNK